MPNGGGLRSWWSQGESNPRPLECHSSALPTELWPRPGTVWEGAPIIAFPVIPQHTLRPASSLLFVLDVATDDFGHVRVLFFLFFDEGVVGVVLDRLLLHLLGCLRPVRGRRLLALAFGVGLFERDQLCLL